MKSGHLSPPPILVQFSKFFAYATGRGVYCGVGASHVNQVVSIPQEEIDAPIAGVNFCSWPSVARQNI
jgi:hypothetical protein